MKIVDKCGEVEPKRTLKFGDIPTGSIFRAKQKTSQVWYTFLKLSSTLYGANNGPVADTITLETSTPCLFAQKWDASYEFELLPDAYLVRGI